MSAGPPPVPHRHALSFLGPAPRCLRCGAIVRGAGAWLDAGCPAAGRFSVTPGGASGAPPASPAKAGGEAGEGRPV